MIRSSAHSSHRFLLLPLLLLAAGCGLSEYEAEMAAEQRRIDALEEEAKLLGEPAELPVKIETAPPAPGAPPAEKPDVFLRLPKGIVPKGEPFGELVYRFPRDNTPSYARSRSSGGGEIPNLPFQEVYAGAAVGGKSEEFIQKVLQPFGTTPASWEKVAVDAPGRGRLEFVKTAFEDSNNPPSSFQAYFCTRHGVHVAVIFRMAKDQAASVEIKKGINVALQSLAVGPEAAQQRQRLAPPKKSK